MRFNTVVSPVLALVTLIVGACSASGSSEVTGTTSGGHGGAGAGEASGTSSTSTTGAGGASSTSTTGAASSTSTTGAGGTSSTSTTGAGGASSTSTTGAGGASSTSTTGAGGASSTSTTSTQGTGGAGACAGTIDVALDNGAPVHFTSVCYQTFGSTLTTQPVGYLFSGGAAGAPHGLDIVGCAGPGPQSQGLTLSALDAMGPGTYTMGSTTYTDAAGVTWGMSGDPFKLQVTKLEGVPGVIEGSFTVMASQGSAAHLLQGTFHVCHVEDLLTP